MITPDWISGRDSAALIGMVHTGPGPGAPRATSDHTIETLVRRAVSDARTLADAGFDALIVENMHDVPYLRRTVGPETVAAMSVIVHAVARAVDAPIGVQVLAGANREAMAVARATRASFIRAEGFHFASVADEGLFDEADAGPLLRYRRAVGADHVAVFADLKKKHASHAITADIPLEADARAAAFCGADGVIVTGPETGAPTNADDVRAVREAIDLPVLVGSGVRTANVRELAAVAHGLIVGTSIKQHGDWTQAVDAERAAALVRAARG